MSSQRRFSKGANDNELSLEQRLVMQLSAAMNQEDSHGTQQDQSAHGQASTHSNDTAEHLDPSLIDISGLLGSALGGESDSARHPGPSSLPTNSGPAVPARDGQVPSHIHPHGQLNPAVHSDLSGINPDALLASLLGGNNPLAQTHSNSGASGSVAESADGDNLSHAILAQLGNLGNLGNLGGLGHSTGTTSSASPRSGTDEHLESPALPGLNARALPGAHLPQPESEWHTDRLQLEGQNHELSAVSQHSQRGDLSAQNPPSAQEADAPIASTDNGAPLNTTLVDPEVSSIQSVLQLLLTNGAKGASNSTTAEKGPAANAPSANLDNSVRSSVPSSTGTSHPGTQLAPSDNNTTDYGSLFGLSLGAEDQSLIDSLRNAINVASLAGEAQTTESASHPSSLSHSLASDLHPTSSSSLDERGEDSRSMAASRPKRPRLSESEQPFSSSASSQTEFNASDPDTLRAIQQALLSALGPSAASTSLAESLTNSQSRLQPERDVQVGRPSHEVRLAPAPPRTRTLGTAFANRSLTSTQAPGSSSSLIASPSSSLGAVSSKSLLPSGDLRKSPESSLAKNRRPVPKVSRPPEVDKQKQREGNAARKRKWREVNQMQNRDHDLRQRIIKRAQELYGDSDTQERSTWIEQEFNRRRHRRILRAGIHSIVESAKARAAKAQEAGDNSMLAFGRSQMGSVMGTLSQQSRQAASSHLSHLFRNSNAALEPQLSSEKVPMPLTPYMLVATPKRPPYKLKTTESEPRKEKVLNTDTKDTTQDRHDAPHQNESKASKPKDGIDQEKSSELEGPSKTGTGASKPSSNAPPETHSSNESKPRDDSAISEGATRNSATTPPRPSQEKSSEAKPSKQEAVVFADRPKHRYALVGDVNLGVPPNLGAIYHKIRGISLSEHFRQRSQSSENSSNQSAQTDVAVNHTN